MVPWGHMDTTDTGNKIFLPAAVILAGLLIAGAVIWNGSHPSAGTQQGGTPQTANIKDIKMDGDPYLGAANAPVVIAFWSDFQCPYCKAFEVGNSQIPVQPALPDIVKNYVNTGKVRIVFMDLAFLGNDSVTAGEYGRAIWKLYPDKYFAWRTAMYNAQDQEGDQGFGNADSINRLNATIPGIDAGAVKADVAANKATYDAELASDKAEAQKVGINATPSFVIGTQVLQGAYPYSNFQQAIDATLAAK